MNTQRKLMITIGENPEMALLFPVDQATIASALFAAIEIRKADNNYSATPNWQTCDAQITMRVLSVEALEPPSAALLAAQKEADTNNSRWYTEYTAHAATKKKLDELQAQIDALKEMGRCRAADDVPTASAEELP